MKTLLVSAGIGLAAGLVCFFLSVAFLAFLLLIVWGVTHNAPDMTLTYKAAAPVAVLAAILGFTITLVRSVRGSIAAQR